MQKNYDPTIAFIEGLVQFGSRYHLDKMDRLYATDQSLLFLIGDRTVTGAPRAATCARHLS